MCSVLGFSVHVAWEWALLLFWGGGREIFVHLEFLQVWNLICKLGCADWQPGSCHPCLSFQMLQLHCPPLVPIFLKTNGNFSDLSGTPMGLVVV